MTIYALYGVGKETERTYFYRRTQEAGDGGAGEDASAAVDLSMSMMENSTPVPRTTREDGAGKVGAVLREEGVENVGADEGGDAGPGLEKGEGSLPDVEWRIDTGCVYGGPQCKNGMHTHTHTHTHTHRREQRQARRRGKASISGRISIYNK